MKSRRRKTNDRPEVLTTEGHVSKRFDEMVETITEYLQKRNIVY
jgi:hypothetical protein